MRDPRSEVGVAIVAGIVVATVTGYRCPAQSEKPGAFIVVGRVLDARSRPIVGAGLVVGWYARQPATCDQLSQTQMRDL